ncbi:hypothetical protein, conserved [Babesia bigemina]|uniref:Uncharacterized protein n=1 Tax=Babesia bigemina TaxID=5866 RepID=A0A061D6K1_BABBI|nr:hypothetical protein, conserved [Babesia bigemina]CDR95647.1 hypothetical protein, conserved [Babesia bigemina]|eukprot:XP_012767833.1 hypothetical protein, conserved [Babesia bigemina]
MWRRIHSLWNSHVIGTLKQNAAAVRLRQSPQSDSGSKDSGKSSWGSRDRRYGDVQSPRENRADYDSRPDDDEDGVDIPIDFGVGPRSRAVRERHAFYGGRGSDDGWWNRLERYLSGEQQVPASGRGPPYSSMGAMPWLTNMQATTLGNAILVCCGVVYGLWVISDRRSSARLFRFMNRNFVASRSSLKLRRWHTLLTCAVSHSSLMHLLFNCAMLHQLMNTFASQMRPAGAPHTGLPTLERFLSTVSSGLGRLFWPDERPASRRKSVQTSDILNVFLLSAAASSIGHVCLYSTPVLGASGARHVFKRPGFHDPVALSLRTARRQWAQTFKGIRGGF